MYFCSLRQIETAMFAMPEVANTIPPLFLDATGDADDVVDTDDVVCIEAPSVSRRKKRKASVVIDLE
jgi:hypothetical protein